MKARFIATAAALLLSTGAYADQAVNSGEGYQADQTFVSTKTRAEVRAETIAALKRGDINYGESYPFNLQPIAPTRRAEVRAEMAAAKPAQQPRDAR